MEKELNKRRQTLKPLENKGFFCLSLLYRNGNIELPLIINKVPGSQRDDMIRKAVARVGLDDKLRTKCNKLSGGEKQRVAVARALVHSPDVILADEPCGNLDSRNSESIMELLRGLVDEDTLVVMVTHSKTDARLCDRIITLSDGMVVSDEIIR